jgi:dipeptidyl aminopeptidase/acylaminoacyl peptidase
MGEVFRARDTRLGRDVAIKFLSAALAGDPQALARFEREGRAVAALSHPNIVALYDVGREGDTAYVVTELLEGMTLRERLTQGPLPPRKALDYVRAVADAIAAAHGRGIIHRDLKPENVFVTNDGRIKVLDFGIAHMTAAPVAGSGSETMAAGSTTAPGTMIGTVGYMAPEQVRGGAPDPRTDVFALGVLLYEALTGQAAFIRETPADTVSAILTAEPPEMPRVSTSAGPATERVVRRCLEKEPEERFQSARDLSFALEALSAGTGHAAPAASEIARPRRSRVLPIAAAAAAVAAIALAYVAGRSTVQPAPAGAVTLFSLPANLSPWEAASVSPDGKYLAYTGASTATSAGVGVSLRRLDSLDVKSLSETTAAMPPFLWSPDSRYFGYFVNTSLVVRELPDGPPRALTELPGRPTGAAWSPQGVLVLGTAAGLYRVAAAGGKVEELLRTDQAKEIWRGLPSFLPGGDRFIYTVLRAGDGEGALETRVASIDGRELGTVMTSAVGATYTVGRLLYGLNGALYSQAFDTNSLKVTGERRLIAQSVSQNWRTGDISARASDTGVLVYRSAPQSDVLFTWVDRAGRRLGTVGGPDSYTNFDVSPDGKRIAAGRRDPRSGVNSLALIDVERGVTTPISPRDEDGFDDPSWARDGRQIAYRHGDKLVMRLANGGDERVLVDAEAYPDQFSPDGRFITYGRQRLGFYESWAVDITTPGAKPVPLVSGVTLADEARFSPNQKWVAYASNQSGSDQVWVIPFPPNGETWQISQAGGVQPRWAPDGNELFYLDADGRVVGVAMSGSDPRRAGEAKPLFSTGLVPSNALDQFAVVGDRFLVRLPSSLRTAISSPIEVLINWTAR